MSKNDTLFLNQKNGEHHRHRFKGTDAKNMVIVAKQVWRWMGTIGSRVQESYTREVSRK